MDIGTLLAFAGFVGAFVFGCLLFRVADTRARRILQVVGAQVAAGSDAGFFQRSLRTGIPQISRIADALRRFSLVSGFAENLAWFLRRRGYETDPVKALECLIASLVALSLMLSVLSGSVAVGLLLSCGALLALQGALQSKREEEAQAMRQGVPDVLHSMGACFGSGLSLLQTFQHLAQEESGPLREAFGKAAGAMEAGETPEQALAILRDEAKVPEILFVSVALEVQHRSGGSMQQVLEAARESVATELSLERQLRVQTAQARLSAQVVTVMPFLLVGAISLLSPGFLGPFFSSVAGLLLLLVALGMQVAGVLIARRMLKVPL